MSHPINWPSKLFIAVPCAEQGYSIFWQKLMTIQHIGWHIDAGKFASISNAYIQDAHNKVVQDALKVPGWDRLLWLEHDHGFQPDLLEMHAHQTEPVVAGLYFSRSVTDPLPVAYNWRQERTSISPLQPYELHPMLQNPGVHEVGVVPMGCTSIRRDVLANWDSKKPWYAVASGARGAIMGDDVWFCRHAQDQGWKTYLDTRIKPDHYGLVPFNLSIYSAYIEKLKREGHAIEAKQGEANGQEASGVIHPARAGAGMGAERPRGDQG